MESADAQFRTLRAAIEAARPQILAVTQAWASQSAVLGRELMRSFQLDLPEGWGRQLEALAQVSQRTIEELKDNANKIGAKGWTITEDMDLGECQRLINEPLENLDRIYRRKYTRVAIDALFCHILEQPRAEPLWGLVEQVHSALRRRHYQVALPAAVMLLEALLARELRITRNHVIEPVRRHTQTLDNEIEYLMWFSVEGFVTEFYSNRPFDGPRPTLINRNWVMHGRDDPTLWTKFDVLKVLNAISTILVVL